MAKPHDWHSFDELHEVRQVTAEGEPNRWQIREKGSPDAEIVDLTDAEFDRLRSEES